MSLDEAPLSIRAADQAWFSMLLANDPNTALLGSLRPSRRHSFWAALWPFERRVSLHTLQAGEGVESIPGLRSGSARWIGGLLVLGVGLAATLLPSAAFQGEELSAVTLPARAAPSPPPAVNVAPSTVVSSLDSSVGAHQVTAKAAAVDVTAQVAPPTLSAKKKPAARRSVARRSARRRAVAP
jgi:hypothetical protein